MSNHKTELQFANTKLRSIRNQINEFGKIIPKQNNCITRIQLLLQSGGEFNTDNIGVFTCNETGDIQHLFIKGMTFGEWLNSNMNIEFYLPSSYDKNLYTFSFSNGIIICPVNTIGNGMFTSPLSVDGTANTLITEDTIIEELNYLSVDN